MTIPYNSFFSILLLNTIKYRRRPLAKDDLKNIRCAYEICLGHKRRFNSECSEDVLNDISKDTKCLGNIQTCTSTCKDIHFTSGHSPKTRHEYSSNTLLIVRRPGMSIHRIPFWCNILFLLHSLRSLSRIWNKRFFVIYQDTCV